MYVRSTPADEGEYQALHVKEVHFAKGETRIVTDEYSAPLGYSSDGSSFFSYVLRTGRNWKGTIGEAKRSVDVSALPYMRIRPFLPVSARRDRKLIWVFRDFEPKEDIKVNLLPRWPRVNGQTLVTSAYHVKDGVPMSSVELIETVKGVQMKHSRKPGSCTVTYAGHRVTMTSGSKQAYLNGSKSIDLPTAPFLIEGDRFVVPIAAVVEALGGTAVYNKDRATLDLRLGKNK